MGHHCRSLIGAFGFQVSAFSKNISIVSKKHFNDYMHFTQAHRRKPLAESPKNNLKFLSLRLSALGNRQNISIVTKNILTLFALCLLPCAFNTKLKSNSARLFNIKTFE
jgi:hypothetical protein